MNQLKGACLFGQSGGPTSVINASALGVLETALGQECVTQVYGCAHGVKGILEDNLYDVRQENPAELALLRYYECRIIGVPKTIDNDLAGTDHCPGFGSAAKYIATSCMEIYHDANVYDTGTVVIVEIMGRNAGWLTAAGALASFQGAGPDLIYLPERPFDLEQSMAQIQQIYQRRGNCLVALSEGILDASGKFIAEYGQDVATDAFGHKQMGGAGAFVANEVKRRFGYKVRSIELSLLQRCAAHCASQTDIDEAYLAGKTAVDLAVSGVTDKMVGFERQPGPVYSVVPKAVDLAVTANTEKKVPLEWISSDGVGLTQDFIDYALPLIQGETQLPFANGLPRFAQLKKIKASAPK